MDTQNRRFKDGAIQVTWDRTDALLTVRGKDHDMTERQCRELASALIEAADSLARAK